MAPLYAVGFPSGGVEKHFQKELERLDRATLRRIKEGIDSLAEDPRPQGNKVKALRPPVLISAFTAAYRLRIGDYRVLYDIDDAAKRVVLLAVRRRSEKTYR